MGEGLPHVLPWFPALHACTHIHTRVSPHHMGLDTTWTASHPWDTRRSALSWGFALGSTGRGKLSSEQLSG